MVASTSLEAYAAIKPKLQALHQDILASLDTECGTVSDLALRLNVFPKTVANRISELNSSGLISPTGFARKNSRGRSETVWTTKAGDLD